MTFAIEVDAEDMTKLGALLRDYPDETIESCLSLLVSIGLDHARDTYPPSSSTSAGATPGSMNPRKP